MEDDRKFEIRIDLSAFAVSKSETNSKSEIRMTETTDRALVVLSFLPFSSVWDLFRISDFEFRISGSRPVFRICV